MRRRGIAYSFTPTYRYGDYVYGYWDDVEEDNIKRFHEVKHDVEGGKTYCMTYGPYGTPSEQCFRRWIDMGMPSREEIGGHYEDDHDKYYEKWITKQLENELEL